MYVCMYVCIEVALRGDAHGGFGVPTGPRGGTHRARGSNIPTPQYHRYRVTHAGSYLRTVVRFLIQLYSTRPNFLCDPVVLESICYRTRAKRLINDSKTTGELGKIWTGTCQ